MQISVRFITETTNTFGDKIVTLNISYGDRDFPKEWSKVLSAQDILLLVNGETVIIPDIPKCSSSAPLGTNISDSVLRTTK